MTTTPLANPGTNTNTDFYSIDALLSTEECAVRDRVRAFVRDEVLPVAAEAWEQAEFPLHLVPKLGQLGVVGGLSRGPGCPRMSSVAYGLAAHELARGDSSFATFFGVQSGLAVGAIARCGSAGQQAHWLPRLARCEAIGAFALTEPESGSDAAAMRTRARRDGDDYVLDGVKRWIGNGSIADVVVVWARDEAAGGRVAGFLVERDTPGFQAEVMTGKLSKRGSWQTTLTFDGCRVPAANRLPRDGFGATVDVLMHARYGVAWSALGEATACYEIAHRYALERRQFGKPIAAFQLVQQKLVTMLTELTKAQLLTLQLGRLRDAGAMTAGMVSLAKLNNAAEARRIARLARETLGGAGILNEHHVMRHLADLESVATYEGTHEINLLIVGREITGLSAFT